MNIERRLRDERGQAMTEAALFFFILAPLLGMLLGFTRYFQIREKLLLAAWQGAQLYSSGCVESAEIEDKVRRFLSTGKPALDPQRIAIHQGRADVGIGYLDMIDEFSVSYTPVRRWHRWLYLPQTVEETCYVKHAPHYWDPLTGSLPIPGQPPLPGPEHRW